ncbi:MULTISPECIES: ABC transporter permease [unclassified Plantactinospora]|uniref:ABC transporter permease n=1 Tax=unclassified Plantactinospora TaxID=2631981 RepID=UPI000D166251|nr:MULTISPECIES: ABC transporter permease [unclassified Plantactinospora]AVT31336.1 ABC transporter [Plantactinospora sp. BC1]AVT39869.1 ABC transporter [Plantactinospora sp. BB1]
MTSGVAAVWSHRNTLRLLVRRDLAVKYQQSVLGYLWSLIEPLGMGVIYFFVFGVLYRSATDRHLGDAAESYPLFLITGIFAWMWTSSAIGEATAALTGQARLITTMNLPREVFPIGRVAGRFAEYVAGLPILVAVAIAYASLDRIEFGVSLLALPLAILIQATLLVGIALLLSSLNVLMRDIERLMRLVTRVLFYATPIIYPLTLVRDSALPDWVKITYELNPLVGIFQLHHAVWYPDEFPDARLLGVSVGGSLLVLLAGWWVFRRLEPAVLKEL